MMPAKPVKEPGEAIQAVTPTVAPAQSVLEPPKSEVKPDEDVKSKAETPEEDLSKVNPADICTWENLGDPAQEIIFDDGSKFKFPTQIFQTADLVLSGKINSVRRKFKIEPRSYNYGRS